MVRIKKTVAKLESDLIEDMKAAGIDICEFIASKSSLFLKNQKEREEQTLREEQLAEEQRKYEEQLKRNVNNMTYSYIPQDYSQYRSTFPQPAYPLNWVRTGLFSRRSHIPFLDFFNFHSTATLPDAFSSLHQLFHVNAERRSTKQDPSLPQTSAPLLNFLFSVKFFLLSRLLPYVPYFHCANKFQVELFFLV